MVLDVDDTVYLERDYVRSGFAAVGRHVALKYGVDGFGDVAWDMFECGRRGDTFDAALSELGREASRVLVPELVEVYRAHEPTIELLADSRALVDRLSARQVPIGVITDGPAVSQHAKVKALGLVDVANIVVVTADLGHGLSKPHEAAYLHVQHVLGFEAEDLVYVADNPKKDFVAPHRLGWGTARVRRAGSLHEHLPSGDDVAIEVSSIEELELP